MDVHTTKSWWKRLQEKTKEKSNIEKTTKRPKSAEVQLPETKTDELETNSLETENKGCEDKLTNIAGSMSCKAFLRSFAFQYCKHKYIKKNCCESHKRYCSGSTHG